MTGTERGAGIANTSIWRTVSVTVTMLALGVFAVESLDTMCRLPFSNPYCSHFAFATTWIGFAVARLLLLPLELLAAGMLLRRHAAFNDVVLVWCGLVLCLGALDVQWAGIWEVVPRIPSRGLGAIVGAVSFDLVEASACILLIRTAARGALALILWFPITLLNILFLLVGSMLQPVLP
jgi:hypothetical protein